MHTDDIRQPTCFEICNGSFGKIGGALKNEDIIKIQFIQEILEPHVQTSFPLERLGDSTDPLPP